MKYGESCFDILYLIFAITAGIVILVKRKDTIGKLMGSAALVLGIGDAFHLIPRVLHYFVEGDFAFWLGFGKMVTSITMTVFYILLYRLWRKAYEVREDKPFAIVLYAMAAVRILLCLFPQNGWFTNNSPMIWGVLRNIPFVVLGGMIVVIYFKKRAEIPVFRSIWLLILLSFAFYIPVTIGASFVPVLGALMLPKTVCYMLMMVCFLRNAFDPSANQDQGE